MSASPLSAIVVIMEIFRRLASRVQALPTSRRATALASVVMLIAGFIMLLGSSVEMPNYVNNIIAIILTGAGGGLLAHSFMRD